MKKLLVAAISIISLFGFNSIVNSDANLVEGKVIKAYTQPGYGRQSTQWLFMDVKDKNGKVYKVAIAPTFKIPNLPINEGDVVKVDGFTPAMFPNGVIKAIDIYDVTQKRDYPINYGPGGYGPGYEPDCGYHHNGTYYNH